MVRNLICLIIFTVISSTGVAVPADETADFERARADMVQYQIKQRASLPKARDSVIKATM